MDGLYQEPILPDFLIDPDDKHSLEKMKSALTARALWDEITEAAKEKGKDRKKFVDGLTKEELKIFEMKAAIRVVPVSSKIQNLVGRVTMSSAYDVLRKNYHRAVGEYDTILDFLQDKLDPDDPHGTSTYEAAFLIELLQSFESMGKRGLANKVFASKVVYGKLVAAIPTLRRKHNALKSAQEFVEEELKTIQSEKARVRNERDAARGRREDLAPYDLELDQLKEQERSVKAENHDVVKKLQADLTANTAAAFELAGSQVARDMVAASLPKVAEVYLKRDGYKPEEVSPDYGSNGHETQKPRALSVHLNRKTIFVLAVGSRQASLVSKLLGEMFDIGLSDLDEAIGFLSEHKKKGA